MDIDTFHKLLDDLAAEIPADFFRELNGGILLLPEVKGHPLAPGGGYILGEYRVQKPGLGRYIIIYYGSFQKILGEKAFPKEVKTRLWETLLHELRHHLESLAGVQDLQLEDERRLRELITSHKQG
jgi:hypothetical protein